jgi:adenylylsulfate kinase
MENNVTGNIHWHPSSISRTHREALNKHRGVTVWLTGLSAAGKSTLAVAMDATLSEKGCRTYILDGDNIRHGLNKNLGFSPEDRSENIRRVGEVAKLFTDCGIITFAAFISPYRKDRDLVRMLFRKGDFIEVYVDCPISVCEERDPKGIYQKARKGEIASFTGISAPYEVPIHPEIIIDTSAMPVEACSEIVTDYLAEKGYTGHNFFSTTTMSTTGRA